MPPWRTDKPLAGRRAPFLRTDLVACVLRTAAAITALAPVPASAQPAKAPTNAQVRARQLTHEGTKYFEAKEYEKAIESFREANELFHALTIVLREARAHEKKGDLITARERYRQVIDEELAPGSSAAFRKAQKEAESEIEALGKRIPTLTIMLTGASENVRVSINGIEQSPESLKQPLEKNPGEYTVSASSKGETWLEKKVTLPEGVCVELDVVWVAPIAPPPPATKPRAPDVPRRAAPPSDAVVVKSAGTTQQPAKESSGAVPTHVYFVFGFAAMSLAVGIAAGAGSFISATGPDSSEFDYTTRSRFSGLAIAGLATAAITGGAGICLTQTSSKHQVAVTIAPSSLALRGSF